MSPDHFSPVAGQYAAFRPSYPDELFAWLAGIAPQRELAWDCSTVEYSARRQKYSLLA